MVVPDAPNDSPLKVRPSSKAIKACFIFGSQYRGGGRGVQAHLVGRGSGKRTGVWACGRVGVGLDPGTDALRRAGLTNFYRTFNADRNMGARSPFLLMTIFSSPSQSAMDRSSAATACTKVFGSV